MRFAFRILLFAFPFPVGLEFLGGNFMLDRAAAWISGFSCLIEQMKTNRSRRTWQNLEELRAAAQEGDPQAQCYLGVCYQSGLGVPQEYGQAAKWFREAAEQNDPAAQFNLGVLYETGQGVPQNYAEAVKWYHAAAEQGEPQAQTNGRLRRASGKSVNPDLVGSIWHNYFRFQRVPSLLSSSITPAF